MNWLFWRNIMRRITTNQTHKLSFRPRVEACEERETTAVVNYGGNVLPHVEAQAIFLGSDWLAVRSDVAQTTTLNNFLSDVTGGAYMDALTRAGYGVGRGTTSPGVVDNSAIPANSTISDA